LCPSSLLQNTPPKYSGYSKMGLMKTTLWIGAVCCFLTLLQSSMLIFQHRRNWVNPKQQRRIVLIIAMVPIFALNAFISLLVLRGSKNVGQHAPEWIDLLLDGAKECYESVVISSFLELMFEYTGCLTTPQGVPDTLKGVEVHLPFPLGFFCGVDHWVFDKEVAEKLRKWTMQFVYVRPVLSILTLVATAFGIYESLIVWLPISVALNISMSVAIYALMLFYHSFEQQLSKGKQRPLAKFLCIKGVVFFCFWQGVVVQILEAVGVISAGKFFGLAEKSTMIQDALVCVEMAFVFAPLHMYSFSFDDYRGERDKKSQ